MKKFPKVEWTKEFKEEAVKMVRETGLSLREVANRLSIAKSSLRYWVKKSQDVNLLETTKNSKDVTADEMELSRLIKRVSRSKSRTRYIKKGGSILCQRVL